MVLFLSPFFLFLLVYVYLDPYGVVFRFHSLLKQPERLIFVHQPVTPNYEFDATEIYINNCDSYKFKSFILGGSVARNYRLRDWRKYIDDSACFHWDASKESIWGVEEKLRYLDIHKKQIKNVLIVLGAKSFAEDSDENGHLFVKDYRLSGRNYLSFQRIFFEDFTDFDFLWAYLHLVIPNHSYKVPIGGISFAQGGYWLDKVHNEIYNPDDDEKLSNDREKYYDERLKKFPQPILNHGTIYIRKSILKPQTVILNKIYSLLKKQGATYKIVISPGYDQKKIDSSDLQVLKNIFGTCNVFDFSGINLLTKNKYNFYDGVHYLPSVADQIMNVIYSNNPEDFLNKLLYGEGAVRVN